MRLCGDRTKCLTGCVALQARCLLSRVRWRALATVCCPTGVHGRPALRRAAPDVPPTPDSGLASDIFSPCRLIQVALSGVTPAPQRNVAHRSVRRRAAARCAVRYLACSKRLLNMCKMADDDNTCDSIAAGAQITLFTRSVYK